MVVVGGRIGRRLVHDRRLTDDFPRIFLQHHGGEEVGINLTRVDYIAYRGYELAGKFFIALASSEGFRRARMDGTRRAGRGLRTSRIVWTF